MVTFTNVKTNKKISREDTKEEEFIYEGKPLLVETDMDGVITYANRRFVEVSGYDKDEVIGSPHCAHMHPNMPQSIFKDACQKTIQPKSDSSGNLTGFMATRRAPNAEELENVMAEYEEIKASGDANATSQYCGEVFMGRGACQF